uniref:Regulatory protein zeste n=1 Tax=Heliothis virescens TaxID=7102 RepID=A0A2A4JG48_HELVI
MEGDGQEEPSASAFWSVNHVNVGRKRKFNRHRSPAFNQEEIKCLLRILQKYKAVVFNKSTNASANRAKEVAWLKIAKLFNRQGFTHRRSADCLKIKWDNMKKKARYKSKNLMDINYEEFDEATSQMVAMMCETENGANTVDEPVDTGGDVNDTKNKESTVNQWNGNEDLESNDSSTDGGNENQRFLNRSTNFSPEECNLLLQCVRQEKNIVLSNTNTSSFIKLKNRAWDRISNSYNKLSPEKRSTKVLRTKFTNMKRLVKTGSMKQYFKEFTKKQPQLEGSGSKIKSEPLFEHRSSLDADNDSDLDDRLEADNNSDGNTTLDPLSTVLNSDLGLSSVSQSENKEVVRLKIELLNYKLETAKLKRKRIEDLLQADAAEREAKAREHSLKLRAARLEAIAAEMKLPPSHPALAYTPEETQAQHYIHQYHTA